eukprot:83964-Rhodomonas_salina.2
MLAPLMVGHQRGPDRAWGGTDAATVCYLHREAASWQPVLGTAPSLLLSHACYCRRAYCDQAMPGTDVGYATTRCRRECRADPGRQHGRGGLGAAEIVCLPASWRGVAKIGLGSARLGWGWPSGSHSLCLSPRTDRVAER